MAAAVLIFYLSSFLPHHGDSCWACFNNELTMAFDHCNWLLGEKNKSFRPVFMTNDVKAPPVYYHPMHHTSAHLQLALIVRFTFHLAC